MLFRSGPLSDPGPLADGSYRYATRQVDAAGNLYWLGAINMPPNFNSYFEYDRPRKGRWGFHTEAEIFSFARTFVATPYSGSPLTGTL